MATIVRSIYPRTQRYRSITVRRRPVIVLCVSVTLVPTCHAIDPASVLTSTHLGSTGTGRANLMGTWCGTQTNSPRPLRSVPLLREVAAQLRECELLVQRGAGTGGDNAKETTRELQGFARTTHRHRHHRSQLEWTLRHVIM